LLPDEVLQLPEELARVDALLDDPVFFAPFACYFDPLIGRPCTPAECYAADVPQVPLPDHTFGSHFGSRTTALRPAGCRPGLAGLL
jgi:hypothetical protein